MVFTWFQAALLLFFIGGAVFAAGPLLGSILLAPKARGGALLEPYECGIPAHGPAWTRFGINYYFYALIFLAFEVDILYLFPVAAQYGEPQGLATLVKIFIFILVLYVAVFYFFRKGVFTWPHRIAISKRP